MKLFQIILILFICSSSIFAQVIKQISKPKYDKIQNFKHSNLHNLGRLFLVEKNKKVGLIDTNGRELLPPIYDKINEPESNRIAVHKDKKWGFLNYQLELVIPFQYDQCISEKFPSEHPDRCVIANNCVRGVIDSSGKQIIPNKYSYLELLNNNSYISSLYKTKKFGLMNEDETLIIDYLYDFIEFDSINRLKVKKNGKYGWINFSGNVIIPLQYDNTRIFSEGLACVKIGEKWGFINKKNQLIVPAKLDRPSTFHNGKCFATIDGSFYHMDITGKTEAISQIKHYSSSDISSFENIQTAVMNNLTGYQRQDDSWLIKPQYSFARDFSEGRATIYQNGKWSQIDTTNTRIMPWYDNELGDYANGLISIFKNNKFGYMDTLGNIRIPIEYEHGKRFNDGFALVKKNGKWGYISTDNEVIIDFIYDYGNSFQHGFVTVKKDGQQVILDKKGSIIFDKPYRSLRRTENFIAIGTSEQTIVISTKDLTEQYFKNLFHLGNGYCVAQKNNLYYLARE